MNYKLFDTLLDAVLVVNRDEHIIYCNPVAAEIVNSSVKRLSNASGNGKKFSEVFKFNSKIYDQISDISAPIPYKEIQLDTIHGTKTIQITIQPESTSGESNNFWLIFIRDATLEASLHQKYAIEQKEKRLFKKAAELDGLTGIYNKTAFWEKFKTELEIAESKKFSVCLIFYDIDNFKKLNDTYGHPAGDLILADSVKIIEEKLLRTNDIYGRYGGEEFAIVLHKCKIQDAESVAERIRKSIEAHEFIYQGKMLKITFSIGVGEWSPNLKTAEFFLQKVDEASYVSKKSGKNLVTSLKSLTKPNEAG